MFRLFLSLALVGFLALIVAGHVTELRRRAAREAAPTPGALPTDTGASPASALPRFVPLDSITRLSARIQLTSDTHRQYLDSLVLVTDSIVRRWPVTDAPIWFTVIPGGSPDFTAGMPREVGVALDAWSPLALGLRLLETRDTAQATLIVDWTPSLPERSGVTNVNWDRTGRILRVRVTLATRDPVSGEVLSEHARRAIALHEMGHALGLPHSADDHDAMHPVTSAERPTDRDLTSIRLLYSLPTGWIGSGQRPPPRQ
jgi:hypothetical protein